MLLLVIVSCHLHCCFSHCELICIPKLEITLSSRDPPNFCPGDRRLQHLDPRYSGNSSPLTPFPLTLAHFSVFFSAFGSRTPPNEAAEWPSSVLQGFWCRLENSPVWHCHDNNLDNNSIDGIREVRRNTEVLMSDGLPPHLHLAWRTVDGQYNPTVSRPLLWKEWETLPSLEAGKPCAWTYVDEKYRSEFMIILMIIIYGLSIGD